jgi:hypothetical protein
MAAVLGSPSSSARLVMLAWVTGGAALLLGLALNVAPIREHWLAIMVIVWLAPLAAYDLRFREVPHMACVAVPCAAGMVYSFATGAWPVGVIALMAVAASERRALQNADIGRWAFGGALIQGGALALASGEDVPGAFAVLGFWLAYEVGWWAGADALAAMTLALLWPDVRLLVALGVAHMAIAVVVHATRRLSQTPASASPGLPALLLAAMLRMVI